MAVVGAHQWATDCMKAELASVDWGVLSRAYLSRVESDASLSSSHSSSVDDDVDYAALSLAEELGCIRSSMDGSTYLTSTGENTPEPSLTMRALRRLFREMIQRRVAERTNVCLDYLIDTHLALLPNSGGLVWLSYSAIDADIIAHEVLEQAGVDKEGF
jgi:hypothetical protein